MPLDLPTVLWNLPSFLTLYSVFYRAVQALVCLFSFILALMWTGGGCGLEFSLPINTQWFIARCHSFHPFTSGVIRSHDPQPRVLVFLPHRAAICMKAQSFSTEEPANGLLSSPSASDLLFKHFLSLISISGTLVHCVFVLLELSHTLLLLLLCHFSSLRSAALGWSSPRMKNHI